MDKLSKRVKLDPTKKEYLAPNQNETKPSLIPGIYAAVKNISISNELGIGPYFNAFFRLRLQPDRAFVKEPFPTMSCRAEITAGTSRAKSR